MQHGRPIERHGDNLRAVDMHQPIGNADEHADEHADEYAYGDGHGNRDWYAGDYIGTVDVDHVRGR